MANIAAGDVTYTILEHRRSEDGRSIVTATIAFGDGALTYPAGGVPITKGKLGCPNVIESLKIFDKSTSGYVFSYDRTNEKIVGHQSAAAAAHTHTGPAHTHTGPSHVHDFLVKGGQAAASTDALSIKGSSPVTIGKEAATDATNVGGVGGGVQAGGTGATGSGGTGNTSSDGAVSAAALSQLSTVAIAAQTLKVEVVGW